jgi:glutathione S-transferase
MYRLHSVPDWASLAVHLVLAEAGLPFERIMLDPATGDLDTPAYRSLNPNGKVPTLETPDGPMFETGAILLYLAERHGLAPAAGDPARAAFLTWFVFTNVNVHAATVALLHPERTAGEAAAPEACRMAQLRLREALGRLETMVAAGPPSWAAPGRPSVLTPYLAMLMRWAQAFAWDPACAVRVAEFPALQALAADWEMRPSARTAAAAEGLSGRFLTEAAA